jgi:hypothetical protein
VIFRAFETIERTTLRWPKSGDRTVDALPDLNWIWLGYALVTAIAIALVLLLMRH